LFEKHNNCNNYGQRKISKKLGISIEELEQRIQRNKKAEEDKIESNAKNKPN
jgi:hypothetical protein